MGKKHLQRFLAATTVSLALAESAVGASDEHWVSTEVRGMVVRLVDDHWEELTSGQELGNAVLKTLRSGHLTVATGGQLTIDMAPNTMIAFRDTTGPTVLFQYEGTLLFSGGGGTGHLVVLKAGDLTLTGVTGEVEVRVNRDLVELNVKAGTATVNDGGASELVRPGAYIVGVDGSLSATAALDPGRTEATPAGPVGVGKTGIGVGGSNTGHGGEGAGGVAADGANGAGHGIGNGGNGGTSGGVNGNNGTGNANGSAGGNAGNAVGAGQGSAGASNANNGVGNGNAGGSGGNKGEGGTSGGKSAGDKAVGNGTGDQDGYAPD